MRNNIFVAGDQFGLAIEPRSPIARTMAALFLPMKGRLSILDINVVARGFLSDCRVAPDAASIANGGWNAMKKPTQSKQKIDIQWAGDPSEEVHSRGRPSKAQIRALAIALGQLMARMERARAKRAVAPAAMISVAAQDMDVTSS